MQRGRVGTGGCENGDERKKRKLRIEDREERERGG
jgi:hypothetical protein